MCDVIDRWIFREYDIAIKFDLSCKVWSQFDIIFVKYHDKGSKKKEKEYISLYN